jgi:DNA excision repair protein ERCC-5
MEAEAQCAALEELSLVEGVITDDSDVFLFGSSRVYKNMFNQQKYVECYIKHDIEREMELDRKKLIQIAFLLGSDYTEGIPGIGPVAAMEILAEFSKEEEEDLEAPLLRFKEWYEGMSDDSAFQKKFVSD